MALTLTNLTKSFDEKMVISSLTHTFPEVGLALILGKSGTGKTTLLRGIAGLDTDFGGAVEGGGKANVSFAFQEHRLLPALSALQNVSEALRATGIPREEAAEQSRAVLLSLGLTDHDIHLRPAALSGGMRQRVSLARAFAVKRPILILDEPEKELDEQLRELLYTIIRREAESRLVLVVTHTPEHLLPFAAETLTLGL